MTESERLKFYEEQLGLELNTFKNLTDIRDKVNSLKIIGELEINYRNLKRTVTE